MQLDRFAADDGTEIRVQVAGAGPPIVLLHEWASSHRVWEPIAHRLVDRFTVYRWDARGHHGHGEALSSTTPQAVTVERMADDLACLLDHYRLQQPVVVAHSMGALTLWAYVARHGCSRLRRVGIIDQSPKLTTDAGWQLGIYGDWSPERDATFVDGLHADFVETVVRLVCCGLNRRAQARLEEGHPGIARLRAYLAMLERAPLISVWQSLSRADFRPMLPTLSVPVLLVYGGESNYYLPETGAYVRDAVPDARLVVYEGADHSPHVAQPERFANDLAIFAAQI